MSFRILKPSSGVAPEWTSKADHDGWLRSDRHGPLGVTSEEGLSFFKYHFGEAWSESLGHQIAKTSAWFWQAHLIDCAFKLIALSKFSAAYHLPLALKGPSMRERDGAARWA